MPEDLGDRAADAWEPLLAIAQATGGVWPSRAAAAALALSADGEADETSYGTILVRAIRNVMGSRLGMGTEELLEAINMDASCRLAVGGMAGLDDRTLARRLKPYGIKPRTVRVGDKTPKGYRPEDLHDAWKRYATDPASDSDAQHSGNPQHEIARKQKGCCGCCGCCG